MPQTTIRVIFALPTSISGAVLCNWLNLKSICRLDSALCVSSVRTSFLNLLKSVECMGSLQPCTNQQLVWMNKKLILSSEFGIGIDFSEDACQTFLQRSGRYISSLIFAPIVRTALCENEAAMYMVIQHCHNLKKFQLLSSSRVARNFMEIVRVNPNQVALDLHISAPFPVSEITLPNLKSIHLSGSNFNDSACIMLVKSSPQLRFLSLTYTSVTADGLVRAARFCPGLQFLRPPDLSDIDTLLQNMMPSCMHIKHLCFTYCPSLTDVGMTAVAISLNSLRSIQFRFSRRITNVSLIMLAKHQHHSLEVFLVSESFGYTYVRPAVEADKQTFSAEAVTLFRNECTKLRVFDWQRTIVSVSRNDEKRTVNLLVDADRVTTLRLFYLDDTVLHTIAQRCNQLKVLVLCSVDDSRIAKCSDRAWCEVAMRSKNLQHIHVQNPLHQARLQGLLVSISRLEIHASNTDWLAYSLENVYQKT